MAVHAHPDDESSKGAASTAKYRAEGVDVLVVSCTGGERGDVLNPKAQAAVQEYGIHEVRQREMAEAAAILDVQHAWLGFEDSGFPQGDEQVPDGCFASLPLAVVTEPLVDLIRRFRPHVLTTYDENGGYPHPDHIRTHEVTMAAVEAAADPGQYPQFGAPWDVPKIYYNQQFSKKRIEALHLAMIDEDLDSPYHEWLTNWEERTDTFPRVTTRIDAAEYFDVRDRALLAHATQIDPDGQWFAVPREMERQIWPTEDFELARSLVTVDLPEDDLFAGLRES
jgi:mycothiol S-conjugate amidase